MRVLQLLRTPAVALRLISLGIRGYLVDTGWTKSVSLRSPVNAAGEPIPWVTLPFVDFIEARLRMSHRVFEYGAGASTIFYARRVGQLDTVEHDESWLHQLGNRLPPSTRLFRVPLDQDGEYARASSHWGDVYNLVIVDGRDRVNCIRCSLPMLTNDGCLVLDDSERGEYEAGCRVLLDSGFKRLDFWGMAPGLNYRKCTSVFYRRDNCLDI